jgi:eukaryotic-like serine/threonine-protein kinase
MADAKPFRRLNKFELHQLIGEGAMGVVWKAYDTVLRRYVALKLLGSSFLKTPEMRERFLREARAAGALQHPNIITVYDLGEATGQLFIAMELVEGRDLSDLIAAREPLALERKLDIVIEMLQGLGYAHDRGVIHRDIKPSNVRVAADGRIKIMDFGIARLQSSVDATGSGAIVGTPTYMAPEQITNGAITPATDVFAVGCLLYELLTYQKPFEGESVHGVLYQVLTTDPKPLRTVAPSIPASLERVITRSMAKAPQDRYETAKQLRTTLLAIRAALSGAGETTTQRMALVGLPHALLSLIRPISLRVRLAVLSVLAVVALILAYKTVAGPTPAVSSTPPAGASIPQPTLVGTAGPSPAVNPAVAAFRDSALAARERAVRAGALKNNVASWAVGETMVQTADQASAAGDQTRATIVYGRAITQYRAATREAQGQRADVEQQLARVTPLVQALGTGPEAVRAVTALARADSLLRANDFAFARLAAQDAEQTAIGLGVAPPSPQPAAPREAIGLLVEDLGRAVASERVQNIRALYPAITARELEQWQAFFRGAEQLAAKFAVERLILAGARASADVAGTYTFVPRGGGARREDRPHFAMRFTKTPAGWRIASVRERR